MTISSIDDLIPLSNLGMAEDLAAAFARALRNSYGLILIAGPQGSGTTTTMYASLREVAGQKEAILTVEDRVECDLSAIAPSIQQHQVDDLGVGLMHALRRDPEMLMVSEIRDVRTAILARDGALSGHLIIGSLPSSDAIAAVYRLIELGSEPHWGLGIGGPHLVLGALTCVVAQRLVRTCCASCAGSGCARCQQTGFAGRMGIFEYLDLNESVRQAIMDGASPFDVRAAAIAGGMSTLHDAGDKLVAQGRTSKEEVERVLSLH